MYRDRGIIISMQLINPTRVVRLFVKKVPFADNAINKLPHLLNIKCRFNFVTRAVKYMYGEVNAAFSNIYHL